MNTRPRLQTLRAIAAAAAAGATREHLVGATGLESTVVVNALGNAMKSGQIRSTRSGITSTYWLTKKGDDVLARHNKKAAPGCAPAKPQRKSHDIARITHSDPEGRSGNLSPERRTIERVMREARQGLSLQTIADRAAVDKPMVKRMLQRLQRDGWARLAKCPITGAPLWSLRDRATTIQAAGSLAQPHVNSTQPNGGRDYWARYTSDLMTPARRELQSC